MTNLFKINLFVLFFSFSLITDGLSAQEVSTEIELNIFPNPNRGTFYITLVNDEPKTSQLFAMDGRLVKTFYLQSGLNYISLHTPPGIYLLKVGEEEVTQDFKISIK